MREKREITIIVGIEEKSLEDTSVNISKETTYPIYTLTTLVEMTKETNYEEILNKYLFKNNTIVEMNTQQFELLNIYRLETQYNIIVNKIVIVEEYPNILVDRIFKKYLISLNEEQMQKYQYDKLNKINEKYKQQITIEYKTPCKIKIKEKNNI